MKKITFLFFILLLLIGCEGEHAKQFMWEHSKIKFKLHANEITYDCYSSHRALTCMAYYNKENKT